MKHDWSFHGAAKADYIYAVAVCVRCGVIRREIARDGARIDLGGDCDPDAPRAEKKRSGARFTSI